MHLNGKVVSRIDKLNKNREILKALRIFAENILAASIYNLCKSLACKFTVGNGALKTVEAGKHPGFGTVFKIGLYAVIFNKLSAAPDCAD